MGENGNVALTQLIKNLGALPLFAFIIMLVFPMGTTAYLLYNLNLTMLRLSNILETNQMILRDILREVK